LLFVKVAGLKMTPVTLEVVIDASKLECKLSRDMENNTPLPRFGVTLSIAIAGAVTGQRKCPRFTNERRIG